MPPPCTRRHLGELMDCTICLDEPASPIHSCANGHIICGICVDEVKKCGICQTDLHINQFAERLSRQFEFKLECRNQTSGCEEVVAAAEMKNHLEKCYFRDILCTELKRGPCIDTRVPLTEYGKHLHERHNCLMQPSPYFTLTLTETNLFAKAGLSLPTGILEDDGHTFLLLSQITPDFIYLWATVLGDKETAEEFTFEFKMSKTLECGGEVETSWTIPVVAFHDRPKFVEDAFFYAVISIRMANEFGTPVVPENKLRIGFRTSSRILQKIDCP